MCGWLGSEDASIYSSLLLSLDRKNAREIIKFSHRIRFICAFVQYSTFHLFIHPFLNAFKCLINKKMCSNRFSLRCVWFTSHTHYTHTIRLHFLIIFCGLNLPVQTINYHKNEQN